MGRPQRASAGGYVYHVLNRANARTTIFADDDDYEAFEIVLAQAVERTGTRLLAYCLMPDHWHLVVWPREDGELSRFVGWLSLTHTHRWQAHRDSIGAGHLYQGRFRSFPVQEDEHLRAVVRYVERNPRRAGLVRRAERWRWGSLYRWLRGNAADQALLSAWPIARRRRWVEWVNASQTPAEIKALRRSIQRGSPFGSGDWVDETATQLGLESTLRPRGRPKKHEEVS